MHHPDRIPCPDCSESVDTNCNWCGGHGTIENPIICLRTLRDLIARNGIHAVLYMSGGNCATIGLGETRDDGNGTYFAYLIGPGTYSSRTAYRDEVSAGPDYDTLNWTEPTYHGYCVGMRDDDTLADFASRIIDAYRRFTADHPVPSCPTCRGDEWICTAHAGPCAGN